MMSVKGLFFRPRAVTGIVCRPIRISEMEIESDVSVVIVSF